MYVAFTKELDCNRFVTATSRTDAIERLTTELERFFDMDRDHRFEVAVELDGFEFEITTSRGQFYTQMAVIDVTAEGMTQFGSKPHKCGEWHH